MSISKKEFKISMTEWGNSDQGNLKSGNLDSVFFMKIGGKGAMSRPVLGHKKVSIISIFMIHFLEASLWSWETLALFMSVDQYKNEGTRASYFKILKET